MNETEHLLQCLAEECAEVVQVVSKALRFGLEDAPPGKDKISNREYILKEYLEIKAVVQMLQGRGILPTLDNDAYWKAINDKGDRVMKYMKYARRTGALK